MRGYITGSGWKDYQRTGAVCGIELPAGLRESEQLPEPIFTPSTKADVGHDEAIDFDGRPSADRRPRAGRARPRRLDRALQARRRARARERDHPRRHEVRVRARRRRHADARRRGLHAGLLALLARRQVRASASRQPSFDKQYVRDWASSTGWDRTPPAPAIPDDVVRAHPREVHRGLRADHGRAVRRLARAAPGPRT